MQHVSPFSGIVLFGTTANKLIYHKGPEIIAYLFTLHYYEEWGDCVGPPQVTSYKSGWLGRAMVLGNFQCRVVLQLWHVVGQVPAVLAAGAGWWAVLFCFFFSHLVYPIFLF